MPIFKMMIGAMLTIFAGSFKVMGIGRQVYQFIARSFPKHVEVGMRCRLSVLLVAVVPCIPLLIPIVYLLNKKCLSCPTLQVEEQPLGWHSPKRQLYFQSFTADPEHIAKGSLSTWSRAFELEEEINPEFLHLSEHPDINVRAKFQMKQISHLCKKYQIKGELRLPSDDDLTAYFRHFIFDDHRRVIFCFVPKIGCTNLKRLMLYMSGHLPLDTVEWPWVEENIYLEPALKHASMMNKTLTMKEKMDRWNNYYKFMFVRNPLERLVSAYRNKIEPPLSFTSQDKFPEFLKFDILNRYRQEDLLEWRRAHKLKVSPPPQLSVTFQEFIRSVIEESDPMRLNEHFRPAIDICHPCLARFHFYGNFRNISSDVKRLIQKFGTEPRFYRDESLHASMNQTHRKLTKYYGLLTTRDKVQLLGRIYDDLLFYYTLYPTQRYSHYDILDIRHPIL